MLWDWHWDWRTINWHAQRFAQAHIAGFLLGIRHYRVTWSHSNSTRVGRNNWPQPLLCAYPRALKSRTQKREAPPLRIPCIHRRTKTSGAEKKRRPAVCSVDLVCCGAARLEFERHLVGGLLVQRIARRHQHRKLCVLTKCVGVYVCVCLLVCLFVRRMFFLWGGGVLVLSHAHRAVRTTHRDFSQTSTCTHTLSLSATHTHTHTHTPGRLWARGCRR